jgi:hypothetical protein
MSDEEWSDKYVQEAEETVFECDGKVISAEVRDKPLPDGTPAKYLFLEIQPTSYTGDTLKPQYKIAKQKNGKWIPFLKALKACGVNETGPAALVGKEFHWKRVLVTKFEKDGEDIEVTAMVPMKLLGGASAPAGQPAAPAHPAANLDANTTKVLEFIRNKGATTRTEVSKETGMTPGEVLRCLGILKEAKRVKEDGGALMVA